jgi:hypothetical protein
LIGFQAVLLLLQENGKYEVIHILAYLPHLDMAVRPDGNVAMYPETVLTTSGGISASIVPNIVAELYSHICFP